jgi:hypothetical protein
MKRISMIALLLVYTLVTMQAQNETQALRYSMYNPFGTARFTAQGGAIGALGGDLSAIQVNPAGLGFYRSSELSFTPSFYWVNTSANYLGQITDDSHLRLNVGSFGYVSARTRRQKSGLVSAAFSFGYNTLVNFNYHATMGGSNNQSSLLDDFTWHANADPDRLDVFYEQVASDAYLLPYDVAAEEYWNDIQNGGYGQKQSRVLEQSGYIGEYSLAGALNFSNLLYLGASGGIHSVRFNEQIYHTESDPGNILLDFNSFQFREFNSTSGWGYNFRFGVIIRPVQMVRFGASFQIPTNYYLTEEKYTDASSTWDRGSGIADGNASSPNGIYDYRLISPMRTNVHASVILFGMATFSAAYEYVDYSTARLDAYDDKFVDENDRIRQDLQAAHNIKAGAEVRLQLFYFRGGLQYLMSPYIDSRNNAEAWIYSAGFGVRTKAAFFDMSYSHGNHTDIYGLYSFEPGTNEVSVIDVNANNLMVTIGLKF